LLQHVLGGFLLYLEYCLHPIAASKILERVRPSHPFSVQAGA
jgi:hypothetical protein